MAHRVADPGADDTGTWLVRSSSTGPTVIVWPVRRLVSEVTAAGTHRPVCVQESTNPIEQPEN